MTDALTNSPERRQVTLMFCDLVGSTEMSVRLDPEDLRQVLDAFQKSCAGVVKGYDATVTRFMGDGLLVAFGYPRAYEDAPERAVRAGLEIIEAVKSLEVFPDIELHTRIGISTGTALVGYQISEGIAREHSVLGTTPNLAARLLGLAEPDSVVISDLTHELTGRLFDCESLGEHTLKGFREPVSAWRVVGTTGLVGFDATRRRLRPLVGRRTELDTLLSVWNRARGGEGHVVTIGGDAGVGKSRLYRELRTLAAPDATTVLQLHGVPYHEHSALYAVTQHIQREAGIGPSDPTTCKLDKLEQLIERSGGSVAETAPLLAALLSIPADERYGPLSLSPELQLRQTLAALEASVLGMAHRGTVLLLVEDFQWIDPVTRELLDRLIAKIHSVPVLLVITHRSSVAPQIPVRTVVTRIMLNRLDREECLSLIRSVANDKSLPGLVVEHILEKSDGVPLYVEELTRSVLDSKVLQECEDEYLLTEEFHDLGLPNTLQDSLMARLDRQGTVRGVVQRCAVIGRRFSYQLARAVCGLDDMSLAQAMEALESAELIFPRGQDPGRVYEFKHALVRDAAYSSLLREDRKRLHARVAQALVQDPAHTESELIAHHFVAGGLAHEAIPFLLQAAQRAVSRAAHRQAIRFLNEALRLIGLSDEGPQRDALELNAQALLGVALAAGRSYGLAEVERAYQRARTLGANLGGAAALHFPVIQSGLVSYYLVRAQHWISDELARDFVASAERSLESDSTTPETMSNVIDAYRCLGYTSFFLGDLDASLGALMQCVDQLEASRDEPIVFNTPENPFLAALALMPLVLWLRGDYEGARDRHTQGLEFAWASNQPFNQAFLHSWAAVYHQWCGAAELAGSHARSAVQISSDHGFDVWRRVGQMHLGIALAAQGRAADALSLLTETLPSMREDGIEAFGSYYRYGIAVCQQALGEIEHAMAAVQEAIAHAERQDERFF
ncbi:MAG: ATP-binding protein, partial [Gammaproteobacteria bacterium]